MGQDQDTQQYDVVATPIPNAWITCDIMPTDDTPKDLAGVMTCQGIWDKEANTWRLLEDGKINCEVRQWKEIQDGST